MEELESVDEQLPTREAREGFDLIAAEIKGCGCTKERQVQSRAVPSWTSFMRC